ncbi:hypothetical protein LTR62_002558 [Meristemomyces frigidus]|uniref:Sphingoid long-chain base transporter RSB1 n=1 Tax=Meristemomyces frigidus TaxID=1508187 RepID=A0AAN7TM00_9PEZI|nr:hypothetical protein LTR62_002558 [Meristemomyces frigidus]
MIVGYIDPNFPDPNGPNDAEIVIYGYVPSVALGSLGATLFFIAAVLHLWLVIKYKTWYFSTMVLGLVLEVVGYIFRILSSQKDPYSIVRNSDPQCQRAVEAMIYMGALLMGASQPFYVVQYFTIVVAPVFFSAAIYTIISVLIRAYGRQYAVLPPKVILAVFISFDVVGTAIQVAGAATVGVAYSQGKDPAVPSHVLLGGLSIQVASFAGFLVILGWTLVRARGSTVKISKMFLTTTIVASIAIFVRTCFRVAEGAEGLMSKLSVHEAYFGGLEFAPVVIAVFLLAYGHPGRYVQSSKVHDEKNSEHAGDSVGLSSA